jgi:hypothetical protein
VYQLQNTSPDISLGNHTFLRGGYTIERRLAVTYDQWYVSLGYRFDVKEGLPEYLGPRGTPDRQPAQLERAHADQPAGDVLKHLYSA